MDDDTRLEARMRRLVTRTDPPPSSVLAAAYEAIGWRDVDAELAALVSDSWDEHHVAAVRGADGPVRIIGFEASERGVELQIDGTRDRRRVVGQCIPGTVGRVEIRTGRDDPVTTVPMDDLGRFEADHVPAGPLSLRCIPDDGRPVTTAWITV